MAYAPSSERSPLMIASIFVETDGLQTGGLANQWNDQAGSDPTGLSWDSDGLPHSAMHLPDERGHYDNRKAFGPAQIPQQAEAVSMKDNYARRITMRSRSSVVDNTVDLTTIVGRVSQEEGAAFMHLLRPAVQLRQQWFPDRPRNHESSLIGTTPASIVFRVK